ESAVFMTPDIADVTDRDIELRRYLPLDGEVPHIHVGNLLVGGDIADPNAVLEREHAVRWNRRKYHWRRSGGQWKNREERRACGDALVDDGRVDVCGKVVECPAECAKSIASSKSGSDNGFGIRRICDTDAR